MSKKKNKGSKSNKRRNGSAKKRGRKKMWAKSKMHRCSGMPAELELPFLEPPFFEPPEPPELPFLEPPEPERRINKWTVERDLDCGPWRTMDLEGNVVDTHDAARAVLARAGDDAGEVWLWCLHCSRFFQAKHLELDFLGNWERCPFDDCRAAGLDVDILTWDAYKHDEPDWPGSEDRLYYGLCTCT